MRYIRTILIVLLVISVAANVFLYAKNARRQMQIKINNKVITKKEYHDWLEQHDGSQMMALMTKYYLLTGAAEKLNIAPSKEEVDKEMANRVESNPNLATQFQFQPWMKEDNRRDIEMALCAINLTTKDVLVTDDELNEFFASNPSKWDESTKYHTKVLIARDADTADRVQGVVQNLVRPAGSSGAPNQKYPVPDLAPVQAQFEPKVDLLFQHTDGTWIISRPITASTGDPILDEVNKMKPGDVIKMGLPGVPGNYLIIALESVELGKKATLSDQDIKKRVQRDFKMTRAQPLNELLRTLFDSATIDTDPPDAKKMVENLLLPERNRAAPAQR
ncbi:MAG: hypothetical protein ABJA67_17785 [Chthonomonadales bacterium]